MSKVRIWKNLLFVLECVRSQRWRYQAENNFLFLFFWNVWEASVENISSWRKQVSTNTSQLLSCKSSGNGSFNRGYNTFRIKCWEFRSKQFFTNSVRRHHPSQQQVTKTLASCISDAYHSYCSVKARKWMQRKPFWSPLENLSNPRSPNSTQEYQRHIILLWLQHRQYRSCKT